MISKAVNIAQYLNLSWVAFYPLVNIFGKQTKTAEYIASPIEMHGKKTKGNYIFNNNPKTKPAKRPEFINITNLSKILSST